VRLFYLFSAIFLAACCTLPPAIPVIAIRDVSVALVYDTKEIGVKPFCSGTFVQKDVILTAAHCVVGLSNNQEIPINDLHIHYITISEQPDNIDTGEPITQHLCTLLKIDTLHDLALLKTYSPHSFASVAKYRPAILEQLYFVSTPKGLYFTTSTGYLGAIRIQLDEAVLGPFLQVEHIGLFFGSSGAAAFNKSGEIVGVVSMSPRVPNTMFLIDTYTIQRFIGL
jgi:hypothetical protein